MSDQMQKYNPDEYHSDFSPRRYLQEYYAMDEIGNADKAIASRAQSWLTTSNRRFDSMIDIGSGPVILYPFLFADYVEHLDFSDYLPGNMEEIRKWLQSDPDAFDWDQMLGSILKHLTGTTNDLAAKKQRLREVGRDLLHVDLCRESILDVDRKYDLVTSFHCAECVASTKADWLAMKRKILDLVRPGGSLFFSVVYDCVRYKVLGKWFPVIRTTESDYQELLQQEGFQDSQISIHDCPEFAESGFSRVLIVSSFKPINSQTNSK